MQMYYVAIQNQQCGPYAEDVLRQLMQTNQITPDSLVWCDSLTEWTPLNRVPELLVVWTEIKRPTPSATSDAPRKTDGTEQAEKTDGTKKTTNESSAASDVPPTYNVTPSDETPHSTPNQPYPPNQSNQPYQQPYQQYQPYQPNPYGYGPPSNRGFAGFFRRFAAFWLDGIILNILGMALMFFIAFVVGAVAYGGDASPEEAEELGEMLSGPLMLVCMIIAWLYYALSESSVLQATLGKRLMGIYVTDIYGHRLSFGRATCRWLCKVPSAMIFGIGFLLALVTPRCQALHDLLVGSLVLRR